MTPATRVRAAEESDVGAIDRLVRELAVYEREPDAVEATPEHLLGALFGAEPRVFAHVAEIEDAPGEWEVAGIALWFVTFSTWRGRHGIWLEDLFVDPAHRGLGLGRGMLTELADECRRRDYARLEWSVLDWNEPAHEFYRSLGAGPQDDWTVWRLDGAALDDLGTSRP